MSKIKWGRSDDGFVDSKCGRFFIVPKFWSCVKPQDFDIEYKGPDGIKKTIGNRDTQREAKEVAQRWADNNL